jgi:two-component system NtrC family response regulator/two-component system nitrogen regulation response regulator GlnG
LILVVDDDPNMRVSLELILEDEGYDIIGADDGAGAIQLARETRFPLIFMDIRMPGANGVEAWKEIKKLNPGAVVVMMTGFSGEDLVEAALHEGAYAVIYKPFDVGEVVRIAHSVIKTTLAC